MKNKTVQMLVSSVPCILCGAPSGIFSTKTHINATYDLFHCSACNFDFVYPCAGINVLASFYREYSDIRAREDVVALNAARNIEQMKPFGITFSSRVIDYGCGSNIFVRQAMVQAEELGQSCSWIGYDKYRSTCVRALEEIGEGTCDAVTMWGVLEHLRNPRDDIREFLPLLDWSGYVFITTICKDSLIPFQYKPPEHLTYWSKKAAMQLCHVSGLDLIEYKPYSMIQHRDVYMKIITRTMPEELRQLVSFDRLPEFIEIPTNEAFWVARKPRKDDSSH